MSLDDQLRAVLHEEAGLRTAMPPDVQGLISGGRARRRRRNALWAGGSVLAAVIAAGGGYGVAQLDDDDAGSVSQIAHQPTPQPLPDTPLPDTPVPAALAPGTYVVSGHGGEVVAPYTITVPAGWKAQHGVDVGKNGDQPGAIGIEPFVLDQIRLTDDTCHGEETLGTPQTSIAGLVAGLRAQGSGVRVGDPVADTVGGLAATRIDLDYPGTQALANCRLSTTDGVEPGTLQIWSGYFVLFATESASVYVLDVGDREQVFVTRTRDDASPADRAELQSILDSIRIVG
jgi:hypothetical protein